MSKLGIRGDVGPHFPPGLPLIFRALETVRDAGSEFQAKRSPAGCPSAPHLPPLSRSASTRHWISRGLALLYVFGLITCHRPAKVTGAWACETAPALGARYLSVCRTPHPAGAHSPRDRSRCAWSPDGQRSTGHSHRFPLHRSAAHSCLRTGEDSLRGLYKAGRSATTVVAFVPLGGGVWLQMTEAELGVTCPVD